jgi:hypothetical protein
VDGQCVIGTPPTRTPTQLRQPTFTRVATIITSRGGGCSTGQGTPVGGADLLMVLLLPLALWMRKPLAGAAVRCEADRERQ